MNIYLDCVGDKLILDDVIEIKISIRMLNSIILRLSSI